MIGLAHRHVCSETVLINRYRKRDHLTMDGIIIPYAEGDPELCEGREIELNASKAASKHACISPLLLLLEVVT